MVYQPLVHGSCVLQAVGHDPVAIKPLLGDEGDLLLIFFYHLNLVVSEEGVNKGKKLVSSYESTSWLILGKGKLSFRQALLRSMKSTLILHFPFVFLTMMMLASHSG